ncbi:MAG: hypothetical protein QUS33_01500 [Dehalococcoidia bacterium]|nr:hypothetical protein [Dehalococcoidia bacterium]
MVHQLSENHEGLHSGQYICVSVLRDVNAVAIRGGYYDVHWQPKTICKESIPLKDLTARALGRLLKEVQVRLNASDRGRVE